VLARLDRQAEVPLRDALGSMLAASWLNRRPRPASARTAGARRPRDGDRVAAVAPLADGLVADDPAAHQALAMVGAAASRRLPVLLCGETGSGKERLARVAHELAGRRGPFVAIDCGAAACRTLRGGAVRLPRRCVRRRATRRACRPAGRRRRRHAAARRARPLALPVQAALLRFLDDRTLRPVAGGGTPARRAAARLQQRRTGGRCAGARPAPRAAAAPRHDPHRIAPAARRADFARCARSTLQRIDRPRR
jgi:transcriptional regulator of acetoin/glycerol metabolism